MTPQTSETIINTLIALKAEGLTEGVLKTISYKLRQIARNCNITDPKAVKNYIANMTHHRTGKPVQNATKNKLVFAYDRYCTVQNIYWERPNYRVQEKTPLIPTTDTSKPAT